MGGGLGRGGQKGEKLGNCNIITINFLKKRNAEVGIGRLGNHSRTEGRGAKAC